LFNRLSRSGLRLAWLAFAATALAGCGSVNVSEMNFLPNKGQIFKSQDWAASATGKAVPDFVSSLPVSPEDYVDGAGQCAVAAATAPADPAVGGAAGDLASASTTVPTEQSLRPGGVALGMTECQVVAHAGQPGQVNIGAEEGGERKVVLTYLSGPWPGIYTFTAGRLKVVDRVVQPEQPKPVKKKARGPKTASSNR
jgi:hypothetical protein